MRSIYSRLLLSALLILAFTFLIFLSIVRSRTYSNFERNGRLASVIQMEVEQARDAYETDGHKGLAEQLNSFAKTYPGTHCHFLDQSGRDLLTGADLSGTLRAANSIASRFNFLAEFNIPQQSTNGRYSLLFTPSETGLTRVAIYYALLMIAVILLCCVLAIQLVRPLRQLTWSIRQFGAGNLKARVHLQRRDELGEVGAAFDSMAARIEALLVAERRLLQDISHELRAPLARLSFATELVHISADPTDAIAAVRREIDRLDDLIERLMEISASQGDPDALQLEVVALGDILHEVADACGVEAAASECDIRLTGIEGVSIWGESEHLRRALENLIRNAIHYAPVRSQIEVHLDVTANSVFITVRDYGKGVPPEHMENIFKPFFRVDDSRDASSGERGLGLAIVQRAISLHHGRVWAENAAPGLKVLIELPLDNSVKQLNNSSRIVQPSLSLR